MQHSCAIYPTKAEVIVHSAKFCEQFKNKEVRYNCPKMDTITYLKKNAISVLTVK